MNSFLGSFISGFLLAVVASLLFQMPPCNWQRFLITLTYYLPFLLLFTLRAGVNPSRTMGFLFYSSGALLGLQVGGRLLFHIHTRKEKTRDLQKSEEQSRPSQKDSRN